MRVKLSDITQYSKGVQINGDELVDNGDYIYLNGGINPSGRWTESNVGANTVTISEGGNSSGYINYITEPFWCGAHCYYLFNGPKNTKYLYYALKSQQDRLFAIRSGACMPNIKKSDLGKFEFEFDTNEQKQNEIVATLSRVENVIACRKRELELLDDLIKARFVEMFGDININDKNWDCAPLGELCTIVRGGSPRPIEQFLGGDIPWIKIGDATDGDNIYLCSTKEHIIQEGVKKSRLVKAGSLIFANCGVSLGFARIITFDGCIHDGWLAMEDIDERLDKVFLLQALNQMTEHFRVIAPAGTQPNLNTAIMKAYMQVIPPIELQREFIRFANQVDKSKLAVQKSLDETQVLFDSLMQEYFG
ncbi:MAG: restriction endonuclease subunit S [Clostridiales bacterium]|nr:restriction endonuclease subunit S [Clostridiales bacterium]